MKYGVRFRSRVDEDQPKILSLLESAGWSTYVIGQPVDLLIAKNGFTFPAEIKADPGPRGGSSKDGQKLSQDQANFLKSWPAPVLVLTLKSCLETANQALDATLAQSEIS